MNNEAVNPRILASELLSTVDLVRQATADRLQASCEEHEIGLEEAHVLLEPQLKVTRSRAGRRLRSRMRQRGLITGRGELTREGRRIASILQRAVRAGLAERIAELPWAGQLRLAAAVHLMGGDLDAHEAPALTGHR